MITTIILIRHLDTNLKNLSSLLFEEYFIMIIFFRFYVYLPNGRFFVSESKPTHWFHVVLNYIGPNNGQGMRIYRDGVEEGSHTTRISESLSAGDGRIVVGRWYTDSDSYYSSIQVDELIFFNAALTDTDVQSIYNSA